MTEQSKQNIENLTLTNRNRLDITCVECVESFSEQNLKLVVLGNKMTVLGNGIKILSYDKLSGNFSAEGEIREIKYEHKKQPFIKKIFK